MKTMIMIVLALMWALPAQAHEKRVVAGGAYQFVVGFVQEPAFSGQANGVDLRVTKQEEAVEGLEKTLSVDISKDGKSIALAFEPNFKEPGRYAAYFVPSQEGSYQFRIFGTIDNITINEKFESGQKFDDVRNSREVVFP